MKNVLPKTTLFLALSFIFAGFYLFFFWLWTGQFWQDTRGIDWLVYLLFGERLLEKAKE